MDRPCFQTQLSSLGAPALLAGVIFLSRLSFAAGDADFQRQVRPILSRHCFKCHGPDDNARKAGLRLYLRDGATGPAKSGKRAVVPGKPEESELARRIQDLADASG